MSHDAPPAGPTPEFLVLSYDPQVPSFRYRIAPVIERLTREGRSCQVVCLPSGHHVRHGSRSFGCYGTTDSRLGPGGQGTPDRI